MIIKNGPRRLVDLEVIRALAVCMVLFCHVTYLLPDTLVWFYPGGWLYRVNLQAGVDIFFCLSGFVVTRVLVAELDGAAPGRRMGVLGRFWLRRAFRLWPVAWLWLILAAVFALTFNRLNLLPRETDVQEILPGLGMYMNFFQYDQLSRHLPMGTLATYWTLSQEEQFYALLPVLLLLPRRLVIWALLAFSAWWLFIAHSFWAQVVFRPVPMVAGVLLALVEGGALWRRAEEWAWPRLRFVRPVVGVLLCLVASYVKSFNNDEHFLGFSLVRLQPLLLAVICSVLVAGAAMNRASGPSGRLQKVLVGLGGRSYVIYVVHPLAFILSHEILFRLHPAMPPLLVSVALLLMISALLLVVFTEVTVRHVERPARAFGRWLVARDEGGTPWRRARDHVGGLVCGCTDVQAQGPGGRLVYIEMLRALATCMVLIQDLPYLLPETEKWHFASPILQRLNLGAGTDIFFCIAGFMATRLLVRELAGVTVAEAFRRIRAFWGTRAFRLWPAAWLWLILSVALAAWFNPLGKMHLAENVQAILPGVGMFANFYVRDAFLARSNIGLMGNLATLSQIEQVLLILPVLLLFRARIILRALAGFAIYWVVADHDLLTRMFIRPGGLVAGVALAFAEGSAVWQMLQRVRIPRREVVVPAGCLMLCGVTALLSSIRVEDELLGIPLYAVQPALVGLSCAALVGAAAVLRPEFKLGWLGERLSAMGERSYAIYVAQPVVLMLAQEILFAFHPDKLPEAVRFVVLLPLGGLLLFACSEWTSRIVEQPFRKFGKRLFAGQTVGSLEILGAAEGGALS